MSTFGAFTVTRASTKNVLGSAGTYVSVANNTPAFEFNTDGTYRGLLVEPGATNLLLRSQEFQTTWTTSNTSIGQNSAVAPDGATTADTLIPNNGTLLVNAPRINQTYTKAASAIQYTFSVYVKKQNFDRIQIRIRDSVTTANSAIVMYNLTTGVLGSVTVGGLYTGGSARVSSFSNSWFRVELTATTSTETSIETSIICGDSVATTGDGTSGIFIWQAQLETGPVATSYIVTTGSTASRSADAITLTSASSLIGQTEGTLYAEVEMRDVGAVSRTLFEINDGTLGNLVSLFATGSLSNTYRYFVINGGSSQAQIDSAFTSNQIDKLAWAYKANDFAAYRDGAQIGVDTLGTVPTTSTIRIGSSATDIAYLNGWIRAVALYTTRLSNAQLASLTTL